MNPIEPKFIISPWPVHIKSFPDENDIIHKQDKINGKVIKDYTVKKNPSGTYHTVGVFRQWYADGNKKECTIYKKGKKCGHSVKWDEKGNVITMEEYEKDVKIRDLYINETGNLSILMDKPVTEIMIKDESPTIQFVPFYSTLSTYSAYYSGHANLHYSS